MKDKPKFKAYKIRRPDGMFSTGGSTPAFNKRGKFWPQLNHVVNHIIMVNQNFFRSSVVDANKYPYHDCEIVTYSLKETRSSRTVIEDKLREELIQSLESEGGNPAGLGA